MPLLPILALGLVSKTAIGIVVFLTWGFALLGFIQLVAYFIDQLFPTKGPKRQIRKQSSKRPTSLPAHPALPAHA